MPFFRREYFILRLLKNINFSCPLLLKKEEEEEELLIMNILIGQP